MQVFLISDADLGGGGEGGSPTSCFRHQNLNKGEQFCSPLLKVPLMDVKFGKSGTESLFSNVVLLPQTEVWSLTALPYNHVDDPSSPNISLLSLLIFPLSFLKPRRPCISQPHFLELPPFSQIPVFRSPLLSKLDSSSMSLSSLHFLPLGLEKRWRQRWI